MTDVGYSPLSGMRVGIDGTITYDFDGHISARGLDLLASPPIGGAHSPGDPKAPTDRRVGWANESDGATVAEIYSIIAAGIHQLDLLATGPNSSSVQIVAEGGGATTKLSLSTAGVLGALTQAAVQAAAESRVLIDNLGRSSFVQVDGAIADLTIAPNGHLTTSLRDGELVLSQGNHIEFEWSGSPGAGQLDVYVDTTFVGTIPITF
jgi:hypothetical protein